MAGSGQQDIPFGYAFDDYMSQTRANQLLQPSGPPLLTDQEAEFMTNFFETPNDINHDGNMYNTTMQGPDGIDLGFPTIEDGAEAMHGAMLQHQRSASDFSRDTTQHAPRDYPYASISYMAEHGQIYGLPAVEQAAGILSNLSNREILPYDHHHAQSNTQPFMPALSRHHSLPVATHHQSGSGSYLSNNTSLPPHDDPPFGYNMTNTQQYRTSFLPSARFGTDPQFADQGPIGYREYIGDSSAGNMQNQTVTNHINNQTQNHSYNDANDYATQTDTSSRKKGKRAVKQNSNSDAQQHLDSASDAAVPAKSRKRRKTKNSAREDLVLPFGSAQTAQQTQDDTILSSSPLIKSDEDSKPKAKRRKSSGAGGTGAKGGPVRRNLTEIQKRENHITSEARRRHLIKDRFTILEGMIPALGGNHFSKSIVLDSAATFLQELVDGNKRAEQFLRKKELEKKKSAE